jgi:hypothetical protein
MKAIRGAKQVKGKRTARPVKQRVSERAVLARINRSLAKSGRGEVRKSRQDDAPADYFMVLKNGTAVQYVELMDVAKELGVLKSWEVLSD